MKVTKFFKLEKELEAAIEKKAKEENRSFSNTVETIIKAFFGYKNI